MFSTSEQADIKRRASFYNKRAVAKLISVIGIPRNKQAMLKLLSLDNADGSAIVTQESYDCLTNVNFAVHPQQINVRDKVNGEIIASIVR
jgi:hypothetical protein